MSGMQVRSEMGASVWKILVEVGESVEEEQTLVILESMKMAIPVVAESAGRVVSIAVSEGEMIEEGAVVCEIE